MMLAQKIRFSDIQTSELLYFDPDCVDNCYQFCRERDIDCLPSITDPLKFYRRDETAGNFREEKLDDERIVNGYENIFQPTILDNFKQYPLLFVHTEGELSGVVHFSDYNKPNVALYLFEKLSEFEKALRTLLNKSGLTHMDMYQYLVSKGKKYKNGQIEEELAEISHLPTFHSFYLSQLIGLAEHKQVICIDPIIKKLRNQIMHAHELVEMENAHTHDYIYTFESFQTFFNGVKALHQDLRRVNSRIAFLPASHENIAQSNS